MDFGGILWSPLPVFVASGRDAVPQGCLDGDSRAPCAGAVEIEAARVGRPRNRPRSRRNRPRRPFDRLLSPLVRRHPFPVAASRLSARGLPRWNIENPQGRAGRSIWRSRRAFTRLAMTCLVSEYRRQAPRHGSVASYPGGADCYRFLVRYTRGAGSSPEESAASGSRRMERINRSSTRFDEGRLRRNARGVPPLSEGRPRFFPKTPEEIGHRLMAAVTRARGEECRVFLANAEGAVRREAAGPGAGRGGDFGYCQMPAPISPEATYVSTPRGSPSAPSSMLPLLIAHELVPGPTPLNLGTKTPRFPSGAGT